MNYTLNFNKAGQLDGWQTIVDEINGQRIEENQHFEDGVFTDGFIAITGIGRTRYSFHDNSCWGNFEIMRNAAEMFANDVAFNFIMVDVRDEDPTWKMVMPANEAAFIYRA